MIRYGIARILGILTTIVILSGCIGKSMDVKEMLETAGLKKLPTQADYPQAGGVFLNEVSDYRISFDKEWRATTEVRFHEAFLYFNSKAEKMLTPVLYLDGKDELVSFEARTIQPNGNIITLDKEDLHRVIVKKDFVSFSDDKSLSFTFPGVEEGAILEYSYKIKRYRRPVFRLTWYIQSSYPKLYTKFGIEFPHLFLSEKHGWSFAPSNIHLDPPNIKNHIRKTGLLEYKTQTYSWELRNIPALHREPSMPPFEDVAQLLRVDYKYESWNQLSKKYWDLVESRFEPSDVDALRTLARDIVGEAKTEKEKIEEIFNYLQNTYRYVAIDIEDSGWIPNHPEDIIRNKYGDCKDMSVMAVTLLRALNIKAYPALVKTTNYGTLNTRVISLDFNHMIVMAETGKGKTYWLDATGNACPLGEVYASLEGAKALVLYPDGHSLLKTIKRSSAQHNRFLRNVFLKLDNTGHLSGQITIKATGNYNLSMRSSLREATAEDMHRIISGYVNSHWPDIEIKNLVYDDPKVPAHDFNIIFDVDMGSFDAGSSDLIVIKPTIFKLDPQLNDFQDTDRQYDVLFQAPFGIKDYVEIQYDPEHFTLNARPKTYHTRAVFGYVNAYPYINAKPHTISYTVDYAITKYRIAAGNYPDFRLLLKNLAKSERQNIVFGTKK